MNRPQNSNKYVRIGDWIFWNDEDIFPDHWGIVKNLIDDSVFTAEEIDTLYYAGHVVFGFDYDERPYSPAFSGTKPLRFTSARSLIKQDW